MDSRRALTLSRRIGYRSMCRNGLGWMSAILNFTGWLLLLEVCVQGGCGDLGLALAPHERRCTETLIGWLGQADRGNDHDDLLGILPRHAITILEHPECPPAGRRSPRSCRARAGRQHD